mmetsp:Transcript_45514/g.97564  ORF Transcript_45514/g.97564 Transcript_45514/m.97564 type:complete len:131 (+) Transcript_45514:83-475(+)
MTAAIRKTGRGECRGLYGLHFLCTLLAIVARAKGGTLITAGASRRNRHWSEKHHLDDLAKRRMDSPCLAKKKPRVKQCGAWSGGKAWKAWKGKERACQSQPEAPSGRPELARSQSQGNSSNKCNKWKTSK